MIIFVGGVYLINERYVIFWVREFGNGLNYRIFSVRSERD